LHAYLEADETYAFYSDPAPFEYAQTVENNNSTLIRMLGRDHVFTYPAADLIGTDVKLSSLCFGLARQYRVILAPLGPKPFCLLCLLLATRNPDEFDVWRVGSGTTGKPSDQAASGEILACEVTFTQPVS
jgi:hypothetical protein